MIKICQAMVKLLLSAIVLASCNKRQNPITVIDENVFSFSWGSDSKHIIYSVVNINAADNQSYWAGVYIKNIEGNEQPRLFIGSDTNVAGLDWSEDNDFVAIGSQMRDVSSHVWIFPLDRKKPYLQITNGIFDDENPQFSPDGKRVVFQSNRFGKKSSAICVTSLFDSIVEILTKGFPAICSHPFWDPNGEKIIFTAFTLGKGYDIYEIYLFNKEISPVVKASLDEYYGSYFPDGENIVYFKDINTRTTIWIRNLLNNNEKKINTSPSMPIPLKPAQISPDGKKIAFLAKNPRKNSIVLVYLPLDSDK